MKEILSRHKYITGALIVLAGSLVIGSWMAHRGQEKFLSALNADIATTRALLATRAQITDRNGADDVIAGIVTDCSRRNEFDALLITLGTLSKQDLLLAQSMFESCGTFFPIQKALMVSRLEETYHTYITLLDLRKTLPGEGGAGDDRALWDEVVTYEKSRSDLISEQAKLQKQIINALVQGSRPESADVRKMVSDAQEDAQLISVYDKQIDGARATLKIP